MNCNEYLDIVEKILNNRKFNKLKNEVHHYNSNKDYINTYQVTLDNEDKELLQLMCNNYKEIY